MSGKNIIIILRFCRICSDDLSKPKSQTFILCLDTCGRPWRVWCGARGGVWRQLLFYKTAAQTEYNRVDQPQMMNQVPLSRESSPPRPHPHHLLSIKRIDLAAAPQIAALFAPLHLRLPPTAQALPARATVRTVPVFNGDRLHFTPAFMLEEDQLRLQRNHQNLKLFHRLHMGRLAEGEREGAEAEAEAEGAEGEEVLVPRPTANKYCHVCRGTYEDYLTHTRMPYHLANAQKNKFWTDICKLCARFSPPAPPGKPARSKQIRKRPAGCKRNKGRGEELPNSDAFTSVETKV